MKILDYTHPLPGIKIKGQWKVLWPCYEYIVTITGLPNFGDNILESLILRLADVNVCDCSQLSEMTGLDPDLITFLQERLKHKCFLDKNMCISEQGKAKLKEASTPKPNYYYIYKDAVSGKLLPGIIPMEGQKELVYKSGRVLSPDAQQDNIAFFIFKALSSAGKEAANDNSWPLFSLNDSIKIEEPTPDEIRNLISKLPKWMHPDQLVFSLGDDSKIVYLTIDLILQEGNMLSWLTTDGFGSISPFFSSNIELLKDVDKKYILGLRKKLTNKVIKDTDLSNEQGPQKGEWERYPEIGIKLDNLSSLEPQTNKLIMTSDEARKVLEAKVKLLDSMYQLIEWILYYHINENLIAAKTAISEIKNLSAGSYVDRYVIGEFIVNIAKEIGFKVKNNDKELFRVKLGTIRHSMRENEKHELFSLFDLAIAISKNNKNSSIRKLAKKIPDLPAFLSNLKMDRGNASHAHSADIKAKDISNYRKIINEIIEVLFKKIRKTSITNDFSPNQSYFDIIQEEDIDNEAISKLEEEYGFDMIHILPGDYIQLLIEIKKGTLEKDNILPVVILDQYQLLEKIFYFLQSKTKSIEKGKNYFILAKVNALTAGFNFDETKLPVLKSADFNRIESVLNGKDISLQADFLAWLCSESALNLKNIAFVCKDLPTMINRVAELRGHGELPEKASYNNNEIFLFNDNINKILKYLGCNGFFSSDIIKY